MSSGNNKPNVAESIAKRLEREGMRFRLRRRGSGCVQDYLGAFIALEGIDGAGLSTHASILYWVLYNLVDRDSAEVPAPSIYLTKEPTLGSIGFIVWQAIRRVVPEEYRTPQVMALLFASDRLVHLLSERIENQQDSCDGILKCVVKPGIVITDRYKYSSLAYQSLPTPIRKSDRVIRVDPPEKEWIWEVNRYAPPPHVAIMIDVKPEEAVRYIRGERAALQLYETRATLERVRKELLGIFKELEDRPEYAGMREPYWASLIRAFANLTPECLYPPPRGYPRAAVIERREKIEDTAYEIAKRVLSELENSRIIEFVG